jgi:tRNA threonylcarbamoyladenosine biosynthesis protein TsaB
MALILSLESSTSSCSAALHQEGKLLASRESNVPYSAASLLTVMIQEIMEEASFDASDIEAVAVSCGPGSYTGLRIGVATAKGFCYSRNIPLIAINSLLLLTVQVRDRAGENDILCPMIDARRMEVYTTLLDKNLVELAPITARVIDDGSYAEQLAQHRILFFGTGASKCESVIRHNNAVFIHDIIPQASVMGPLAAQRFRSGLFEDVGEFEPLYLKDFLIRKPKPAV